MPNTDRRPAPGRALLVAAAVLVGIAVLGRGFGGGAGTGVVLEVPPAGQAVATELSDGTPVFVTHDVDGTVHVVEAINPGRFRGLTTLIGWCPAAGGFEDALDGSRFDSAGRHLIGPAPHGLATYEVTRNDRVVLVGDRRSPAPRSTVGDPAVRDWCRPHKGGTVVTHPADDDAELLAVPGQQVRWCDGILATQPPRCVRTVATLTGPDAAGPLPWSWEGPVRGSRADPASVQLLAGGRAEYPARGSLTRVFGRVRRLSTVAETLRLAMNRKIIFGDFFTTARPLELGEPVPRLWKMGDGDGPVVWTYTLPDGYSEAAARDFIGELVDMVVADDRRILSIEPLPRARR